MASSSELTVIEEESVSTMLVVAEATFTISDRGMRRPQGRGVAMQVLAVVFPLQHGTVSHANNSGILVTAAAFARFLVFSMFLFSHLLQS
jgi:hypothetical protein